MFLLSLPFLQPSLHTLPFSLLLNRNPYNFKYFQTEWRRETTTTVRMLLMVFASQWRIDSCVAVVLRPPFCICPAEMHTQGRQGKQEEICDGAKMDEEDLRRWGR